MSAWKLVSDWGSLRSGKADATDAAFHAGHLNDVLRINDPPFFPTLVASDTSGVWMVNELGGLALPLSRDWDSTHLNCLAAGYHTAYHVYAAGDTLYETDTATPAPLLNWRKIPIHADREHLLNPGEIYRAVVVRERRKLVLACERGIFWATIPPPGGAYSFKRVPLLPGQRYSGLAEGRQTQVIAGAWGSDLKNHFGIFVGDWTGPGGDLAFTRATITGGINQRMMLRTEIASCAADRGRMYAVCGGGGGLTPQKDPMGNPVLDGYGDVVWVGDDLIYRVLRSDDGGASWKVAGDAIVGSADKLFGGPRDVMGHTQGGYNICIGASPLDRELVLVGVGTAAVSKDGGKNWAVFGGSDHLHADTHATVFDPFDPAKVRLYVCSDGGLASTPDLGGTFATGGNRQLPNFQFNRFTASFQNAGLVGGCLQDNGNVYTTLYVNTAPWTDLDGGDGVLMMIPASGHLLRSNNTLQIENPPGTIVEFGNRPRIAAWDAATKTFKDLKLFPTDPLSRGVIPVDATGDGLVPAGANVLEVVDLPNWKNAAGLPLLAVAGEKEAVYGLFGDGKAFAWNYLTAVPHLPDKDAMGNELPYFATAVASRDGNAIWVGMNNGKVFRLDAPGWSATELTIPAPAPTPTAVVGRFAMVTPPRVFAVADARVFRYDGAVWADVTPATPAPVSGFTALAAYRTDPTPEVFAATASQVWGTGDDGATWTDLTGGLPRNAQVTDLRFVTEASGAAFLNLSTYGWSAFRRLLNFDDVLKTVTVTGHMDIVDRVAVGSDDWAHPAIANTLHLGPFHPYEEIEYTEDDGDEVQVVLKLKFQWHIDFSIVVDYDATLRSKDDDDESDHQAGQITVPFSVPQTLVIDLATDELWPDRAHIELTVSNP